MSRVDLVCWVLPCCIGDTQVVHTARIGSSVFLQCDVLNGLFECNFGLCIFLGYRGAEYVSLVNCEKCCCECKDEAKKLISNLAD